MKNRIWIASLAALTFSIPAIASADVVKVSTNQPVKVVKIDGPDRDKRADVVVVSHDDRNGNRNNGYNNGYNNDRHDDRNDNRYNDNRNYNNNYNNNYNIGNSRHGRLVSTSIISTPRKNIRNGCGWGRAYFKYADGHKTKADAFMCVTRNGQWRVANH